MALFEKLLKKKNNNQQQTLSDVPTSIQQKSNQPFANKQIRFDVEKIIEPNSPITFLLPIMVEIPPILWQNGEIMLRDNTVVIDSITSTDFVYRIGNNAPQKCSIAFAPFEFNLATGTYQWQKADTVTYAIHIALRIQLIKELGIYDRVMEARKNPYTPAYEINANLFNLIPQGEIERGIITARMLHVFSYPASYFLDFLPTEIVGVCGYRCGESWEQGNPNTVANMYKANVDMSVRTEYLPLNCGNRMGNCRSLFCPAQIALYIRGLMETGKFDAIQAQRRSERARCSIIFDEKEYPSFEVFQAAKRLAEQIIHYENNYNSTGQIAYSIPKIDICDISMSRDGIVGKLVDPNNLCIRKDYCLLRKQPPFNSYPGCPEKLVLFIKQSMLDKSIDLLEAKICADKNLKIERGNFNLLDELDSLGKTY